MELTACHPARRPDRADTVATRHTHRQPGKTHIRCIRDGPSGIVIDDPTHSRLLLSPIMAASPCDSCSSITVTNACSKWRPMRPSVDTCSQSVLSSITEMGQASNRHDTIDILARACFQNFAADTDSEYRRCACLSSTVGNAAGMAVMRFAERTVCGTHQLNPVGRRFFTSLTEALRHLSNSHCLFWLTRQRPRVSGRAIWQMHQEFHTHHQSHGVAHPI